MRLLLISFFFPPFNNMGAVRVGKTAKYLTKFGHEVRVITAKLQPFQPTLSLEIPPENVISTRWINVNKPAETIAGGHDRVTAKGYEPLLRSRQVVNGLRFLYRNLYKSVAAFPDDQIGWLPFALSASSRLIERWKPELIFASAPPYTSLLVGHRVSQKHRIPWVAELRDLWVDNHYYYYPNWRKKLEEVLERRVLSSAAGLLTVSSPLAEALSKKYGKPVSVVSNGFDPEDYPFPSEILARSSSLRIVYTGTLGGMVHDGARDISPLFEGLRRIGLSSRKVRVELYGRNLESARESARLNGVEHLLAVNNQVPYREALRIQREADILLLLLWNDPKERGVFTGKLFEYMGAGRPILVIGPINNVAAELVGERGAGVVMNDPVQIGSQLEHWIKQKDSTGTIPAPPSSAAVGLTREEQTARLDKFLRELVN